MDADTELITRKRVPLFCSEGVRPGHHTVAGPTSVPVAAQAPARLTVLVGPAAARARAGTSFLENCIASTSIFEFQATKSQRWMPWHMAPMKDVCGCEKPRGAADRALIRGCLNGETHQPSWVGTPV
jgi:hypothetical protein